MRNHMIRIALSIAALLIAVRFGPLAIIAASAAIFLAGFAAQHDVAHGALKSIPKRLREHALSAVGALLLMSGHSMRALHLRHHARLFAGDDLEGASAKMSLVGAVIASPGLAIRMRIEALRTTHAREKRFMMLETALNLAAAVLLPMLFGVVGLLYVATAIALQLTMATWAGHIPHRAPRWAIAFAESFAFTGSPTMLSLAYHELHHEHPRVPTARLGHLKLR